MLNIVYNGEKEKQAVKEVLPLILDTLFKSDPDVVYLDADLMSSSGTLNWAKQHSDRAFNTGIQEANMIGIAAGLAAQGFKPIAHSFGPFASRRCYDQAFISAGYAKNPITILGSDAGIAAAFNGGTHMPFEDMALYCAMPEATVIDITDNTMLKSVLGQAIDREGVKYIRFSRKNLVKVYEEGSDIPIGKAIELRPGKDVTIFAAGIMIDEAMRAAKLLEAEGIDAAVVDMFTIKPLDEEAVINYAKRTGAIVTAENHNRIGGLYSAVCSVLAAKCPTAAEWVAVDDSFGEVGPIDYLQARFKLTAQEIVLKARRAVERKAR